MGKDLQVKMKMKRKIKVDKIMDARIEVEVNDDQDRTVEVRTISERVIIQVRSFKIDHRYQAVKRRRSSSNSHQSRSARK